MANHNYFAMTENCLSILTMNCRIVGPSPQLLAGDNIASNLECKAPKSKMTQPSHVRAHDVVEALCNAINRRKGGSSDCIDDTYVVVTNARRKDICANSYILQTSSGRQSSTGRPCELGGRSQGIGSPRDVGLSFPYEVHELTLVAVLYVPQLLRQLLSTMRYVFIQLGAGRSHRPKDRAWSLP